MKEKIILLASILVLTGCMTTTATRTEQSTGNPYSVTRNNTGLNSSRLSLGLVQQTLKRGVSKESVILALGSPNMVTGSSGGQEVWVYDAVATESVTNSQTSSVKGAVVLGSGSATLGVGGGSGNSASSRTVSQRQLTVIIRFADDRVVSYDTRYSAF